MSKKSKDYKKAMGAQLTIFASESIDKFDDEEELKDHLIDRLAHIFLSMYDSDNRKEQVLWFEFDGSPEDYKKKIIKNLRKVADEQEKKGRGNKEKQD